MFSKQCENVLVLVFKDLIKNVLNFWWECFFNVLETFWKTLPERFWNTLKT